MNSLKRLVWFAFAVVIGLLGSIVLLGANQYRLDSAYNKVISQNERALFQYMTIRESITENLIGGSWLHAGSIADDIEKLNGELNRLKENKLVSAELKIALVDKIDLTGLAILLRQVIRNPENIERSKKLQEQLRSISDYLIQFDRIIVDQARTRIVSFQTVVIGTLGLIVSLASFSLILLYRNTVSPLIQLSRVVREDNLTADSLTVAQPVVTEVAELIEALIEMAGKNGLAVDKQNSSEDSRTAEALLGVAVNETTNRLNGIINYAQLLYDSEDGAMDSEEHRVMLQKIIESGSGIAEEWQKFK